MLKDFLFCFANCAITVELCIIKQCEKRGRFLLFTFVFFALDSDEFLQFSGRRTHPADDVVVTVQRFGSDARPRTIGSSRTFRINFLK
jgi:hypothetical protein